MPKYIDPTLDGLQDVLPYPKRNGKDGFLVARGKSRTTSKGGRNGRVKMVTSNPLSKFINKKAVKPVAPKTRKQLLMGEVADYYRKVW